MASQDFTGATDSTFNTAGNWTSAVPLAGDNATFTLSSAPDLDGADKTSVNLASLAVGPLYSGQIASSGSYLIISADEVALMCGASVGDIFLDSGATDSLDRIVIDSASTTKSINLKGDIGVVIVRHGTVNFVSGTVAAVYVEWNGIGQKPTINNIGATITAFYGATNFTGSQSGSSGAIITTYEADHGTMTVLAGKVVNYQLRNNAVVYSTSGISDEPTTLEVWNGATFDATSDVIARTWPSVKLHQGGTANFNSGLANHTITAPEEFGDSQIKTVT